MPSSSRNLSLDSAMARDQRAAARSQANEARVAREEYVLTPLLGRDGAMYDERSSPWCPSPRLQSRESFASVTNTPGRVIDFEPSVLPRQEEPGTEMLDAAVPYVTSPYGNLAEPLADPESDQQVVGQADPELVDENMQLRKELDELKRIESVQSRARDHAIAQAKLDAEAQLKIWLADYKITDDARKAEYANVVAELDRKATEELAKEMTRIQKTNASKERELAADYRDIKEMHEKARVEQLRSKEKADYLDMMTVKRENEWRARDAAQQRRFQQENEQLGEWETPPQQESSNLELQPELPLNLPPQGYVPQGVDMSRLPQREMQLPPHGALSGSGNPMHLSQREAQTHLSQREMQTHLPQREMQANLPYTPPTPQYQNYSDAQRAHAPIGWRPPQSDAFGVFGDTESEYNQVGIQYGNPNQMMVTNPHRVRKHWSEYWDFVPGKATPWQPNTMKPTLENFEFSKDKTGNPSKVANWNKKLQNWVDLKWTELGKPTLDAIQEHVIEQHKMYLTVPLHEREETACPEMELPTVLKQTAKFLWMELEAKLPKAMVLAAQNAIMLDETRDVCLADVLFQIRIYAYPRTASDQLAEVAKLKTVNEIQPNGLFRYLGDWTLLVQRNLQLEFLREDGDWTDIYVVLETNVLSAAKRCNADYQHDMRNERKHPPTGLIPYAWCCEFLSFHKKLAYKYHQPTPEELATPSFLFAVQIAKPSPGGLPYQKSTTPQNWKKKPDWPKKGYLAGVPDQEAPGWSDEDWWDWEAWKEDDEELENGQDFPTQDDIARNEWREVMVEEEEIFAFFVANRKFAKGKGKGGKGKGKGKGKGGFDKRVEEKLDCCVSRECKHAGINSAEKRKLCENVGVGKECTHCSGKGHTVEACWSKNPRIAPESYKRKAQAGRLRKEIKKPSYQNKPKPKVFVARGIAADVDAEKMRRFERYEQFTNFGDASESEAANPPAAPPGLSEPQ